MQRWLLAGLLALCGCPEQAAEPDPKAQIDGLYLAGTTAYLKGDFAAAHQRFDDVERLSPRDPRLPAAKGELLLSEGKVAEALAQFEAATRVDPKRGTNWSRLGACQSLLGRRVEARTSLRRALELNAGDFNALEQLGELELKQGQLDAGVDDLLAAAQLSPEAHRALLYLRASGELSKAGRRGEALTVLLEARQRGLKAPELLSDLGDLLIASGRLAEAVGVYRDAAAGSKDDPTLWELVGELEQKRGRLAEAEAAFLASLKLKERALPHVALARLCLLRKDRACAQERLARSLGVATGEEPREVMEVSDLLVDMGRPKDGLQLLSQLAQEPDHRADVALQLKVAAVARAVGDRVELEAACARVRGADAGVVRCP